MLIQAFALGDLWDAYGIVGDIIVSFFIPLSLTFIEFLSVAVHERLSQGRH